MSLELSDKIEWVDLKKIKLNPKNTNKHPEDQIERLVKLINYQGFRWPLLVWKEKNILAAGEGRYLAAKKLGLDKVPVSYQSFKDEDQFKAFVTSDNAIASWAELDLSLVNSELESFDPGFDLDLLGIKGFELEPMDKYADKDADAVPENVETRCKPGDLWILGEHRLLCGDSTNIEHVERLMGGEKADITFTSPPYNIGKTPNGNENKYKNYQDNKSASDFKILLNDFTNNCLTVSDYVFSNIQSVAGNKIALIEHLYDLRDKFADTIIWDKETAEPAMARKVLNSQFEYIHIFSNEAKRTIGKRDFRGSLSNVFRLNSRAGKEFSKIHKATFRVEFPEHFLKNFTESSCLDVFGGTGTTLIASEKTNRKCFMMELDPHYCDVIITRFEEFTGKKAELNA